MVQPIDHHFEVASPVQCAQPSHRTAGCPPAARERRIGTRICSSDSTPMYKHVCIHASGCIAVGRPREASLFPMVRPAFGEAALACQGLVLHAVSDRCGLLHAKPLAGSLCVCLGSCVVRAVLIFSWPRPALAHFGVWRAVCLAWAVGGGCAGAF